MNWWKERFIHNCKFQNRSLNFGLSNAQMDVQILTSCCQWWQLCWISSVVLWSWQKKQDKLTKLEDDQLYAQLHDAMEALTHICRDGCRSIGSTDKNQTKCSYAACNRMESLVRHFADCKLKVAGGCMHCKRMWQLLELHSRLCRLTGDSCKVPLCRYVDDFISIPVPHSACFMYHFITRNFENLIALSSSIFINPLTISYKLGIMYT